MTLPFKKILAAYLFLAIAAACASRATETEASLPKREKPVLEWKQLPALPDALDGRFLGAAGGALFAAGGTKGDHWSDAVFALNPGGSEWKPSGKLPLAAAYRISLPWKNGFVILGGRDETKCSDRVWLATRDGAANPAKLKFEELPKMLAPLALHTGAIIKGVVYIIGGARELDRSKNAVRLSDSFFCLDLNNAGAGWRELPKCPGGPRLAALAGVIGQTFYVFGGMHYEAAGVGGREPRRKFLSDSWSYHPEFGWKQLAPLPRPLAASGACAMAVGQSHLLLPGGISSAQWDGPDAAPARAKISRSVLAYHSITNTWTELPDMPFGSEGALLAPWDGGMAIAGGSQTDDGATAQVWHADVIETKATFGWINYAALIAYLLGMVGIGWYCTRRNKSTDDYFKAGGRIPWWAAGMAIYATMLSSLTFMAIPAKAYATDWTYIWTNVPIFLIAPVLIAVYLPFFRRLNVTSAYEYLEKRFSLPVRIYGSAAFILFQVGRQAIVLLLPSIALATVSDLDVSTCIVLMGVLCVVYTVMGGIEAVIWTDVAQTFLLLGAALVSVVLIIFSTDGGLAGFWQTATAGDKFHMFNMTWSPTVAANAFWAIFIGNIFGQLVPYTSDQAIVQRYMTTENEKKAASSIWFNAVLAIPSTVLFFLIGTALFVFYKAHPGKLDPSQATDSIFPAFIVQNLPVGIAGLVIAGIFAAAQSTVSGSLNSVVTALMTDFYGRFGGKAKDAAALRIARVLTAILGAFATVCALALAKLNLASLWDAYSGFVGLAASGLAGLFSLGILSKRASGAGALTGAVASIAVLYYVQRHTNLHFFLYAAVGMITCFTVGWLASLVFPSRKNIDGLTFRTLRK